MMTTGVSDHLISVSNNSFWVKLMFNEHEFQISVLKLKDISNLHFHLKLWVALARHNFKWMNILIR